MMNFCYLVLLLCLIQLSYQDEPKAECKLTEEQAQTCASKMLLINDNFTIPKDEPEISRNCDDIEKGIECFKDYAKNCLDSFQSRVMSMVSKNGKKMKDKICLTAEVRTEFLNHIHCWKTAENMKPINLCMDKYIVQMESLVEVDSKSRISATCCSFHILKECLHAKSMETCDKPESVEYLENLTTGVTNDMLKFLCGNYKTIQDCNTKMDPAAWAKLKDMVSSDDPNVIKGMRKYASPFGALKDIMKKFKS